MKIDDDIKKAIDDYAKKASYDNDDFYSNRINKADYDKTLIGFVSEKIIPENPKDDNDFKWRIQTNGIAYDIKPSACNITAVGQRVRLYVPNHSMKNKYAEVIENTQDDIPIEIKKVSDNKVIIKHKDRIVTWTADGSGDTRTNLKYTIEWI